MEIWKEFVDFQNSCVHYCIAMWKDYVGEKWVCPLEDWGLQKEAESGEFVDFLESRGSCNVRSVGRSRWVVK